MKEKDELYSLLYCDEEGEVVGLEEVQLLEPIPANRIQSLLKYLSEEDEYISYQIALVLTSWGQIQGLDWLLKKMLNVGNKEAIDIDKFGSVDLFYEKAIEAIYFYTLSGGDRIIAMNSLDKALELFFDFYVNGRFRNALLKLKPIELKAKLLNLFITSIEQNNQDHIASLLPVIGILDELMALEFIRSSKKVILSSFDLFDSSIESLNAIHNEESNLILQALLSESPDPLLVNKGRELLQKW